MTQVRLPVLSSIDVEAEGVHGNGLDCSTALQALVDKYLVSEGDDISLRFRQNRTYKFSNVTVGDGVTGRTIRIEGSGQSTVFTPNNNTQSMLTVNGTADGAGDYFDLWGINFVSNLDHPYDKPLVKLYNLRNIDVWRVVSQQPADAGMTGTGTLLQLDSSYSMTMRQCWIRTHRYAVPFEFLCSLAVQCDTFHFDQCFFYSNYGPIFRQGSSTDVHGILNTGLKVVSVGFQGGSDFGEGYEDVLQNSVSAGATTFVVPTGHGVNYGPGDPVAVGWGNLVEANRITSKSTDTMTVAQPFRFAHAAGQPILTQACFTYSIGSGIEAINFYGSHWEGHMTGAMLGNCKNVTFDGCYNGAREFIRLADHTLGVNVRNITMAGVPSATANTLVKVPTWNANPPARVNLDGPFEIPSGGAAITYIDDASNLLGVRNISDQSISGIPRRIIATATGGGAAKWMTVQQGATSKFLEMDYNGVIYHRGSDGNTSMYDGAGSGSPEGVITSTVGGLYRRTDGGAGTTMYVKESGTGNTGWVAK